MTAPFRMINMFVWYYLRFFYRFLFIILTTKSVEHERGVNG